MSEMSAVEKMRLFAAIYARHRKKAEEVAATLAGATYLMRKWGEASVNDAVYREAKERAINELELSEGR